MTKTLKRLKGYGAVQGVLKDGSNVKIFRRKNRFFIGNRMGQEMEAVVRVYKTDHTALSGELNLEKFLHTTPFKLF